MGLDVSANVVFGKVVKYDSLIVSSKKRACHHDTDESKKFYSECGKPVFVEHKEFPLDSFKSNGISYFYPDHANKINVIVGFLLSKTDSHRSSKTTDFHQVTKPTADMVSELMEFFSEHNIKTEEADFKEYVFMYFSY